MKISIYIVFLFGVVSCDLQKKKLSNNDDVPANGVLAKQAFNLQERDIIISLWYLEQYEAMNLLATAADLNELAGSKSDTSPIDLLRKQDEIVDTLDSKQIASDAAFSWLELQEQITKGLCSKVGAEFQIREEKHTFVERAKNLLDQQQLIFRQISW